MELIVEQPRTAQQELDAMDHEFKSLIFKIHNLVHERDALSLKIDLFAVDHELKSKRYD